MNAYVSGCEHVCVLYVHSYNEGMSCGYKSLTRSTYISVMLVDLNML